MAEASGAVRALFEAYARATDSTDPAFFATAYGETFMFAGPATVQAIKRDDFLKVVPKRRAFFATVGLAATKVSSIDESPLDEHHRRGGRGNVCSATAGQSTADRLSTRSSGPNPAGTGARPPAA
jgi:hypothetical protein